MCDGLGFAVDKYMRMLFESGQQSHVGQTSRKPTSVGAGMFRLIVEGPLS